MTVDFSKADEATQQARRDAVKGKSLLFVIPPNIDGFVQQRSTVRLIRGMGVRVIPVFDTSKMGKLLKNIFETSEEKFMDDFIVASLDQNSCANIVKALKDKNIKIDAVFTPYENAIGLVGELNEALNCHGNSAKSYKIARSKNLAREATRSAGLATPKTAVAKDEASFRVAVETVGYPCIIKPSSGAGSCGVLRADDAASALVAFHRVYDDLKSNTTLSVNLGLDDSQILIEQCLVGDEFDVDMLIYDGELKYAEVADNWPCLAPYYLETGCNNPSVFPPNVVQELKDYAFACVKAMGFHTGPFHVEVMYTKDGPVLIEVNARQGGGPNQIVNIELYGVNILENWIISTFGVPINPPRSDKPKGSMSQYSITSTKTGILRSTSYMDKIRAHPMHYSSTDYSHVGDSIVGTDTGFPMWTGEFIIKSDMDSASTVAECKRIVEAIDLDIVKPEVLIPTLTAADETTQELRKAVVRDKSMLFVIPPNIPGMVAQKATVRLIRSMGIKLIAAYDDSENGRKVHEVMKGDDDETFLDDFVYAKMDENPCANIVNAVKDKGLKIDSVFTPYENAIGLVGELNEALGCYGNSSKAYKIARSKNLARDVTRAAKLATPRTGVADNEADFIKVVNEVGFPCIVKPSSGAGSCGVVRADSMEQALKAFRDVEADMKGNATLSCNLGLDATKVLVEQCLIGDEFDVDMTLWEGELKYAQVVDNWPCLQPFYLETGCNMPTLYPKDKEQALIKYAYDCVIAMGFKSGPFHVEVMYTADGPVLIEVNARQGGGPNQIMNIEMFGVNILQNWIISTFGVPVNPPRAPKAKYSMVQYSFTAKKTGILLDQDHMKPIEESPYFYERVDFVHPGDKVTGLDTAFPIWTNDFILKGDIPVGDLKKIVEDIVESTDIHIKPEDK